MQLLEFYGPNTPRKHVYSDGAKEFRKAMTNLFIPHTTSTPGRHETNALAERTVQSLSSAVRVLLEQSGLEHALWPFVDRFAAFAINTNVVDGASPWGRRHGENWMGSRFPFGCRVAMMPSLTSTKETPKFGPKAVPGIFLGYNIQSGGVHHGGVLLHHAGGRRPLPAEPQASHLHSRNS